ncbi:MAG: TnpV protein [Lachnospiraceae bacterium]|nr:TnpV protein [Lachnospiraceae bacterium]
MGVCETDNFLKEHRFITYTNMILEGTLFEHLAEIDESCNNRMEIICKAMAEREGVTEA